ncbi:hypothetical protein BDV10DRAFT_169635 [Aspergillus recurvatus]
MAITALTNYSFSITPLTGFDIPVDQPLGLIVPYLAELDSLGIVYALISARFPSHYAQYAAINQPRVANVAQYGGWLLPPSVIQTNNSTVTAAFGDILEDGALLIGNVGVNVSEAVAGDIYYSVLPAWRDTLIPCLI